MIRTLVLSLYLSENNVNQVLTDARDAYPAVFWQDQGLRIDGRCVCADIDGCVVRLRLDGRFWHERRVVFDVVAAYLRARIPEICDVEPTSLANLDDTGKQAPDFNGDRLELERLGFEPSDTVVIQHRPGLPFTGYNM